MNVYAKRYQQYQAERDVSGSNFPRGSLHFKVEMGPSATWNPHRSFFRIRFKITDNNDAQLTQAAGIAPNMFLCDNLFQQLDVRCAGVVVDQLDDYVAQVGALRHRLENSDSWLKTVGRTEFSHANLYERMSEVTSDGGLVSNTGLVQLEELLDDNSGVVPTWVFDYDTPNQVEFTATNLIIFTQNAGAPIPDLRKIFRIGDRVYINDGVDKSRLITLVEESQLTVDGGALTAVAAADLTIQFRVAKLGLVGASASNPRRAKEFEMWWQPPLGFFSADNDKFIPAGNYRIEMTPHPSGTWEKYVIESFANKVPNTDYKVEVVSMLFEALQGERKPLPDGSVPLAYEACRCQAQNLTTQSNTQKTFVVNPQSHALSLFYQASDAGENTTRSRSKFVCVDNDELNLTRFYIQWGRQQLPSPQPDIDYDAANGRDFIVQRYKESLLYAGQYFNQGGQEDIQTWIERGTYYHFLWPKRPTDEDNERCYVNSQFSALNERENEIFLCDHWIREASLSVRNGVVVKAVVTSSN